MTHMLGLVGWGAIGTLAMAAFSGSSSAEDRPEPAAAGAPLSSATPDTSPLVHESDFNVPVATLWKVFTTEEGLKLLGVAQARIDVRVGGEMQTHYDPKGVLGDDGTITQTILAFEPQRVFAFRIARPPKGFPFMNAYKGMWSVATMSDLGPGRSHLRLALMGFTADDESQRMRAFFDQGNAWVMQTLKKNLEGNAAGSGGGDAAPSAASSLGSGEVPSDDPLAPIVTEAVVDARLPDVWKCWTTSAGIASFLADARVELRIGGPFEIYFVSQAPAGQRGSEGCTVLSYEPMRMLSFSWNAPPKFGPLREKHTWVVVQLDPYGPHSCKVTLRHMGFSEQAALDPGQAEGWREIRAYFANAWPSVLTALREHFEVGEKGTMRE